MILTSLSQNFCVSQSRNTTNKTVARNRKTLVSGLAMPRSKNTGATFAKTRLKPCNLATLKLTSSGKVLRALLSASTDREIKHTYDCSQHKIDDHDDETIEMISIDVPDRREPKPQMEMYSSLKQTASKSDSSRSSFGSASFTMEFDIPRSKDALIGDNCRRLLRNTSPEEPEQRGETANGI